MNVFIAKTMNLAERDNYIYQMEAQLDSKKNAMFAKHSQLDDLSKTNKYLHTVKKDYINYYDYMIKEKIEQINALKKIQMYISNLNSSLNSTHETVSGFKHDEDLINKEISNINLTIDKIMKVTPDKYNEELFKIHNVNVVNPKPINNVNNDTTPIYNKFMDKTPANNVNNNTTLTYDEIMNKNSI